jgi:hypothetical protein
MIVIIANVRRGKSRLSVSKTLTYFFQNFNEIDEGLEQWLQTFNFKQSRQCLIEIAK